MNYFTPQCHTELTFFGEKGNRNTRTYIIVTHIQIKQKQRQHAKLLGHCSADHHLKALSGLSVPILL